MYNTAIYRFEWKGEECVTIGLAGHILAPDFCDSVLFDKSGLVFGLEDGEMLPADMPDGSLVRLTTPSVSRSLADGISIKGWKLESLPYSPGTRHSCRPRKSSFARSRTLPRSPTASSSLRTSTARVS